MTEQDDVRGTGWDRVVEWLQEARHAAGDPSYAAITERVVALRVARGEDPHAARVARSTVYDCFRIGRTRLSVPLVRDIALCLDVAEAEVDARIARRGAPDDVPADAPADGPADAPADGPGPAAHLTGPTLALGALIMVASVALNLSGRGFANSLQVLVHLDMVGTAIVAVALGPWRGAAVGAATNVIGAVTAGPVSLAYAVVNVTGALLWGYGVRRWGLGRSLPRFLGLNVLVALACTVVALGVIALLYGPDAMRSDSDIIGGLATTTTAWAALSVSNLVISLGDKMLSGFVALAVVGALPASVRRPLGGRLVGVHPATVRT